MSYNTRLQIAKLIAKKKPIQLAFVFYHGMKLSNPEVTPEYKKDLKKKINLVCKVAGDFYWTAIEVAILKNQIKSLFKYVFSTKDADLKEWSNEHLLSNVSDKHKNRPIAKSIDNLFESNFDVNKFIESIFKFANEENENQDQDKLKEEEIDENDPNRDEW